MRLYSARQVNILRSIFSKLQRTWTLLLLKFSQFSGFSANSILENLLGNLSREYPGFLSLKKELKILLERSLLNSQFDYRMVSSQKRTESA